jgi:hypothetical protein
MTMSSSCSARARSLNCAQKMEVPGFEGRLDVVLEDPCPGASARLPNPDARPQHQRAALVRPSNGLDHPATIFPATFTGAYCAP